MMSEGFAYAVLSGVSGLTGFLANNLRKFGQPGFSWVSLFSNLMLAFCMPAGMGALVRWKFEKMPDDVLCGLCGLAGAFSPLLMDAGQKMLQKWFARQETRVEEGKYDPPT